MFFFFNILRIN